MPPDLRTIARFTYWQEAVLWQGVLETRGISACIQDLNLVQVNWLLANAIGGLRLQVADADARTATDLLAGEELRDACELMSAESDICPDCSSRHTVVFWSRRRLAFAAWLVVGFPIWPVGISVRCIDCRAVWS